jgi:predicted alpha/beta superfamily hydrolase
LNLIRYDGGVLQRHTNFNFGSLAPRYVDVWLPPTYEETGPHHPVLYMHDGQNLFDPASSYAGIDWGIDEAVMRLAKHGEFIAPIVVGIWNSPERRLEYMPQKPAQSGRIRTTFARTAQGSLLSDAYLDFLVHQVKPFIDAAYHTLPGPESTSVMGSSMGGLISLYALEQYPDVFGAAGCVSTHWPAGRNWLVHAMGLELPRAGRHRLYFDYGTATLDAEYEPYQRRMDEHVREAGYQRGDDWVTLKFPGAEHSERAWRERVHLPLQFLLGADR